MNETATRIAKCLSQLSDAAWLVVECWHNGEPALMVHGMMGNSCVGAVFVMADKINVRFHPEQQQKIINHLKENGFNIPE